MPRIVLANAFSLGMLPTSETILKVKEVGIEEVKELLARGFESAVGHETTAQFLTQMLNLEVKAERRQIVLTPETKLIVFQLLGRLPEGRVLSFEELSKIPHKFYVVEIIPPQRG
jgi:hypothetical protein